MNRDYRKWWSPALDRDMELLVFGDKGTPVLVFPTSMGRFYQWEDFGLIAHMAPRIEAGWLQLWCVDSVDGESFYNKAASAQDRARRHLAYERYLIDEVLPAIRVANPVDYLILTGASFGAFHALALAARRPGIARKAVGMSGAYDASRWLDGDRDGDAYFVNPLAFLPNLSDERYLAPLRETEIVIATGREDPNVEESRRLVAVLQQKGVPAALHVWEGWAHDWPYWKEMVDTYI
ncbi:MAG TPA: alpha/beta hydrolase-fold protein [Candidatus Limnocylindria bacterium]|nr:alpha/beta hydrolase-fold protein [Candidatus Limnocylindria bacterium]